MITLKNGIEIQYNEDFDVFFQVLLEKVVIESRKEAEKQYNRNDSDSSFKEIFLKELMDNAIYISHQLFDISKKNRKFAEFVMTGFLFNSIIISMAQSGFEPPKYEKEEKDSIH